MLRPSSSTTLANTVRPLGRDSDLVATVTKTYSPGRCTGLIEANNFAKSVSPLTAPCSRRSRYAVINEPGKGATR